MLKTKLNNVFLGVLIFLGSFLAQDVKSQINASHYTESSILSEGKWVKIRVKENGIYKLTYNDIQKMGFSNPAKIKIYGYGGWILTQDFTKPYIDDLPEVAVWKSSGNADLKTNDFLLFYGRGSIKWDYATISNVQTFKHENNPYDTYGYYFIKEDDAGPKMMEKQENYSSATTEISIFDDYLVHEREIGRASCRERV